MYKIKFSILFITILFLTACNNAETPKLLSPTNVNISKNVISFDEVENASSYIININNEEIEINTNTYTINDEGEFTIKIKAVALNFIDSNYTDEFIINVKFLDYPKNIRLENNLILYDEVIDAASYNISINGMIYNSKEDTLPVLDEGIYEVMIQAVSNTYVDSNYSPINILEIREEKLLISTNKYQYSKHSTFNLQLASYKVDEEIEISEFKTGEEVIDNENLVIDNNKIYLKSEYINSLNIGTYNLVLTTNLGIYHIELEIHEKVRPYVYTNLRVKTNNPIFKLELFESQIESVIGNDITKDDYIIDNNEVTIKSDYIKDFFNTNETKNLILSILLKDSEGNSDLIIVVIEK